MTELSPLCFAFATIASIIKDFKKSYSFDSVCRTLYTHLVSLFQFFDYIGKPI